MRHFRKGLLRPLVCLCLMACEEDPASALTGLMVEAHKDLNAENISLSGCELTIRLSVMDADGESGSEFTMRTDLSLFRLDRVRIVPVADGQSMLVAERLPVSDRLLDQAEQMVRALPPDVASKTGQMTLLPNNGTPVTQDFLDASDPQAVSRDTLRNLLSRPGGQLSVRVAASAIDGEPLKADEDAPAFFDYARRVEALPGPQTTTVNLLFQGGAPAAETLFAGTVSLPATLQLRMPTEDGVKALAAALNEYKRARCDRG